MKDAKIYLATLLLCSLLPISPLHAREMRALIVGVSEYPNLTKEYQLKGPRNDAVRSRNVLLQRGFAPENITVLADGVSESSMPTRANILAELARLANWAARDDIVFCILRATAASNLLTEVPQKAGLSLMACMKLFCPEMRANGQGKSAPSKMR